MKGISLSQLFYLLIALIYGQDLSGQRNVDSIVQRYSRFYSLANLKVSDDNRWISFNKIYKRNSDTTIVAKADQEQIVAGAFPGISQSFFLDNDRFLWYGKGKAQVINLRTQEKKDFEDVIKAEAITSLGYYIILHKDHLLEVYDGQDHLVTSIPNITQTFSNGRNLLYLISKSEEISSIWMLKSKTIKKIYTSEHLIKKLEVLPSQKNIAVTEQKKLSKKLKLVLLNTRSDQATSVNTGFVDADYIKVSEIKNGDTYFLDFEQRIPPISDNKPLIWYGSDTDLWLNKLGDQRHEYWSYNVKSQKVQRIDNPLAFMLPIDNERYFLSFDRKERNEYISSVSWFDIHLYDRSENLSTLIFPQSSTLVISPDGRFMLGFSEAKKRWVLYDTLLSEEMTINNSQVGQPTYSKDNKYAFFESDEGLYCLDLKTKKLERKTFLSDKKVIILDPDTYRIYGSLGADFKFQNIDTHRPVILKVWDKNKNETSFVEWYSDKIKTILSSTSNRVGDFKCNGRKDQFVSIEENFNKPQAIYTTVGSVKKKLYQSNIHDQDIKAAKQEILHYKNSFGASVKGVLYYPMNFDPSAKYPMVLSIYEVQSKNASMYLYPHFSEIGINVRSLIDNGYFVFLPDVIIDRRGPGLSILDCVHSGLDALKTHGNIDLDRVGLMGHSFGGFGTSFVATHSNRFAAYIAGASVTDLVKFYFSFSEERKLPNYPRFENGQFSMKVPFSENKMLYYDNSPISNVERVTAPILLWTGTKDTNVPYDHTAEFYTGLLRNRKKTVALFYKDQDHDLTTNSEESIDLHLRILDWWDYFLKGKKNVPWIEKEMKKDAL